MRAVSITEIQLISGGDAGATRTSNTNSWGERTDANDGTYERRSAACEGNQACMEATYDMMYGRGY
ncbi:hypothetical protein [Undibacterium sp. TC9W]|uniref:hypothetical protein n=1 Tax=Undibacterium sp. TC9W TaxID=3413053 RepID=UPI003BF3EC06